MRMRTRNGGAAVTAALVAGVVGWVGLVAIGWQLWSLTPDALGFDLELLLQAGRDVAAGRTPYDPALLGGGAPVATGLFYSYPPPVALAMVPFAGVPTVVALVVWGLLATLGLLAVVEGLRRRLAPDRSAVVVLAVTAALVPLDLPLAVGLLFGNLDVFFPSLYGLMLLAVVRRDGRGSVVGGLGLAVAALKLHPASIGIWFLVRGIAARDRIALAVVGIGALAGAGVVLGSIVVGGTTPWIDYAAVVRAGTAAIVVDERNAGIAALLAGAVRGDDATARRLHLVVGLIAIAITVWAAWRRGDVLEGFAWATAASMATLPVTWYHYPSALVPVAAAAWLRAGPANRRRVAAALVAALVVAAVAIAALALLWLAIGLVILAARWSRPPAPAIAAAAGPASRSAVGPAHAGG